MTEPVRASGPSAPAIVWASLAVVLSGAIGLGVWQLLQARGDGGLPILGEVPAFELIERAGTPLAARDLAGRVWIADFVFTRCGGTCPMLSDRLAAFQRRLAAAGLEDVTAVSFTVDPEHDDPSVLRAYAARYGADPTRWLFATGPHAAIESLVRDGFRVSVAELPPGERDGAREPITHSDRFVLVDRQLRIRGYYHALDDDALVRLEADVRRLVDEPR